MDLATETATVWPVSEAKVAPNWRKDLGEALAKHLTSCGFNSNLQGWHFSIYNLFVSFLLQFFVTFVNVIPQEDVYLSVFHTLLEQAYEEFKT